MSPFQKKLTVRLDALMRREPILAQFSCLTTRDSLMDLPDDFYTRLLRIRGGCQCGNLNSSPPCSACEDVMTNDEANQILSELAIELPERLGSVGVVEVLRLQTLLIEHDFDGTIKT